MKSLKRVAEEIAVWYVGLKLGGSEFSSIPIFSGKRYAADLLESGEDGDAMVKPCVVIGCSQCISNPEMYDPALGEAILTIAVIRDVRAENLEALDGLPFFLSQIFLAPENDPVTEINETPENPHFNKSYVHEFAPPEETELVEEDEDTELVILTMHLQHIMTEAVAVEPPPENPPPGGPAPAP